MASNKDDGDSFVVSIQNEREISQECKAKHLLSIGGDTIKTEIDSVENLSFQKKNMVSAQVSLSRLEDDESKAKGKSEERIYVYEQKPSPDTQSHSVKVRNSKDLKESKFGRSHFGKMIHAKRTTQNLLSKITETQKQAKPRASRA